MAEFDPLGEFESRLRALKHKLESGLIERARILRELAARVEAGDASARKELKTESHKLRGVAGSYGHDDLTELAGQLEQRASVSPPATVGQLARELADLAEHTGTAQPGAGPGAPRRGPVRSRLRAAPSERPAAGASLPARSCACSRSTTTRSRSGCWMLTLRQVGGFDAPHRPLGAAGARAAAARAVRRDHRRRDDARHERTRVPQRGARRGRTACRS